MYRIILVSALLAIAAAAPQDKPLGRVVGGVDSNIEDYPYQLSIFYNNRHWCSAVLVSDRFAVTIALCADGAAPFVLQVRGGTSYLNKDGVLRRVKKVIVHPEYDSYYYDYDLALLELEEPFPASSGVRPVGLPEQSQSFPDGAPATVTGWGAIKEGSSFLTYQLQSAKLPMVSNYDCAIAFRGITDRMVCAGGVGKGACTGDLGSPIVIDGKLVGLSSWGYGCALQGYPNVFASIPSMRDFLRKHIGF